MTEAHRVAVLIMFEITKTCQEQRYETLPGDSPQNRATSGSPLKTFVTTLTIIAKQNLRRTTMRWINVEIEGREPPFRAH